MHVAQFASVAILAAGTASLAASSPGQRPSASQPDFRTGVELLTVDVTALDAQGRQVTDLAPAELAVQVDGEIRSVISADYVQLVDPRRPVLTAAERRRAGEAAGRPRSGAYVSTNNAGALPGRLILLIIDQGNIRVGGGGQAADKALTLVDRLQPEDRVGVALIPAPGAVLDFTTDHDRVRETLMRAVGTAELPRSRFNLSATEARTLHLNNNGRLAVEVLLRECGANLQPFETDRCQREIVRDAAAIVMALQRRAAASVDAIQNLLVTLAGLDAVKQAILFSEGLVLDDVGGSLQGLATAAADARVSLDVAMLDLPSSGTARPTRSVAASEDRSRQREGLERLASLSRGSFFRVTLGTPFALDRMVRALEGYYLLSLETRPGDDDRQRRRITVRTSRKGVTLRTRPGPLRASVRRGETAAEAVSRALRSPLPANDLPMRLSTWSFKEPGTARHRLLVTVEVEHAADQPLEYVTALALVDQNERAFAPDVATERLASSATPGRAVYATTMVVEPGSYRLRVAMADGGGRVGTIERPVEVFLVDGSSIATSDLLLTPLSAGGTTALAPATEPQVQGQPVAAVVEAYLPAGADRALLEATLDVTRDEQSPPIMSIPLTLAAPRHDDIAALQTLIETSVLPPGRYLARASIVHDGQTVGHALRPFRVEAGTEPTAPAVVPSTLSDSLVGALPPFDGRELFAPALTAATLAQAATRGPAVADAVADARAGDYAAGALAALLSGDQALAALFKGLDLLEQGDADRAAMQFQVAMSQAPEFLPARLYLGATLATQERHRDAAGLLQSGTTPDMPALIERLAGEEWLRAGEFARAIGPLSRAAARPESDPRTKRALGLAYVMANQAEEGLDILSEYLDHASDDAEALLAGVYAIYARHAAGPQASLAADAALAQTWLKAYRAAGGTLTLAGAWVDYLDYLEALK